MNDNDKSTSHPLRTIILTALITLIAALVVGYVSGVLYFDTAARSVEEIAMTENKAPALYTCGMHPWIISEEPGLCPICNMELTPKRDTTRPAATEPGQRKILYWRAPMNPAEIYDKPGKSAMGMDLVPVYEDEVAGGETISIDPVTQQNMGVRTGTVVKGELTYTIRTYGHITYDETRLAKIAPKFSGWIEKLLVDFTGQKVEAGQPLFEIYSPELVTAQEEYLSAFTARKNMAGTTGDGLTDMVRQRLLFYDIAESEIKQIEEQGRTRRTITVRSPFTGIVTHKNAVAGGYVTAGQTVYEIADISHVWVEAHIYEYELPMVREGLTAEMTLPYLPGRTYTGRVTFVYPYLQRKTRDVVIRLEFDNPDMALKPDMYADVRIQTSRGESGMMIPDEAILRSGERNIVFVARGDGKFTPREVRLGGALDDGMVQILSGLATGETIVTSGQFMLDSESRLKEAVQKMMEAKIGKGKPAPETNDDFFDDMDMEPGKRDHTGKGVTSTEAADDFFSDME